MPTVLDILKSVRNGSVGINEAEALLRLDAIAILGDIARIDAKRYLRRGVPEIIYAYGKKDSHLEAIVMGLLRSRKELLRRTRLGQQGEDFSMPIIFSKIRDRSQANVIMKTVEIFNALSSRDTDQERADGDHVGKGQARRGETANARQGRKVRCDSETDLQFVARFDERSSLLIISPQRDPGEIHGAGAGVTRKSSARRSEILKEPAAGPSRGRIALISAGTSDIPALDEAEVILQVLGCETLRFNDVGVAGLHRLLKPMKKITRFDPDAIIVAAGMEGALPSIIASLSAVPVVGLPTSVGYGYGGRGEASLMSMLQACPLGIAVVNIDAGVSAGVIAYLIAKRSHPRT